MGGAACFQVPTAPVSTRDGAPSMLGCGAFVPVPAPAAVMFHGSAVAFGTGKPIASASIKLYSSADFATPFVSTTSAADGTYSLTVPQGTSNEMFSELSEPTFLRIFVHNVRLNLSQGDFNMFNLQLATTNNIESAGLLVKENWDTAYAVVAGTALDCNGVIVMHAAVVVSTTPGTRTFAPRTSVYYGAPGAVPLAVLPEDRGDTNDNGAFALFHASPGTQYVQMWGFKDAAAMARGEDGLTLLAEQPLHVLANTASQINLWTK